MINLAEDANRRVRADAAKQQATDEKAHEGKKEKLLEDIATHKKNLQEMVAAHREKEQELRKVSKFTGISILLLYGWNES